MLFRSGAPCALYLPAPVLAQAVTLIAAALYAVFSGWGLPAQRTVWTLLALQGLRWLGCTWPPHAVWLALMAGIAVFDPYALSQSGFWLSYVAVGLLYGLEPAAETSAWRQWWAQTWVLQWQITLVLMPMSLYFFQGVSVAGLWVNLWAIPWVTWVVTPLALMGMWFEPLWTLAGWAVGWLLMGLDWVAQSPWALAEAISPPLGVVIWATISAMLAIQPGPWAFRAWCGSLMLPLLWWS